MSEKIEELKEQLKQQAVKGEAELASLMKRLSEIQARAAEEQKEREHVEEKAEVEMKIKAETDKLERNNFELAEIELGEIEKKAQVEAARIAELDEERERRVARFQELRLAWEACVPKYRQRLSTKLTVKMQKMVDDPGEFGFDIAGSPVRGPKRRHKIEDVFLITHIEAAEKAGWRLCAGEKIPPLEELTNENSILRPRIATPEIFDSFFVSGFIPVPVRR
jgi:hypothetical protein